MLSFSSVFGGGSRGGGMTNPSDQLRRQGTDRGRAPGRFTPSAAGAQFSVAGGNSPRNRGRRSVGAVAAAQQARRQATR